MCIKVVYFTCIFGCAALKHNILATRMTDTSGASAQPSVIVNQSYLGRMEEFTPGSDWKHYVERLKMFFEVNSIPMDKRVPSILTLMGSKSCIVFSGQFWCPGSQRN